MKVAKMRLGRLIIFLTALGITAWGLYQIGFARNLPALNPSSLIPATPPEWTEDQVIEKINRYREEQKLTPFKVNEALNNAARARLAVILEFDDFDGKKTGLTREAALSYAGYSYAWIGDLNLIDFYKNNDPIEYWKGIPNSLDTLKNKNLTEIGVALKQTPERVNVYVILASSKKIVKQPTTGGLNVSWGGPELWEVINKRRMEYGVNPLKKLDALCTISSIRLNQILEINKLDGHAGFIPTLEREDLKWISEKYNISEFLASGYKTPEETVKGWENTLGHKILLSGGEYVWGCVYAQNSFSVAIAAY